MKDRQREMVQLTRGIVCSIWDRAKKGASLDPTEERIARILREHPEYKSAWDIGAVLVEPGFDIGGANPFLHVHLHLIVEQQLLSGDPPEARRALEAEEARCGDRHDAVHSVAAILVDQMRSMMQNKRPFDRARYAEGLRRLIAVRGSSQRIAPEEE